MFQFRTYARNIAIFLATIVLLVNLCECYRKKKVVAENENRELQASSSRVSKNLFPFVWVTFQGSPCGSNLDGVCVQKGKCSKRGGSLNGNCQDGFGECCMFTEMCSVNQTTIDVTELVTTLKSPSPIDTQCSFRFRKEPNICQIRLDFVEFNSASADAFGDCDMDRLRIDGSITVDNFVTCGKLTGQHMYLTYGSRDVIEVSPLLKTAGSNYRIVATKIPCDSKNRAPDYCLQYYTKTHDIIKSFDFGGQQQNNQQYTICVKPLAQSSEIQWMPCTGVQTPFSISTPVLAGGPIPPRCMADWIQIKGKERMCDDQPFPPIKSGWKPYEVFVYFDKEEFPPPPPSFILPLPNGTCSDPMNTSCMDASVDGVYNCNCDAGSTNSMCVCLLTVVTNPTPGLQMPPLADIDNKGFCLEYTQL
ncbi:hypothetical protein Ocin01_05812 [Orchesella cincta]|uniref:CUB domain-containing protein n=1 Tax=Orchesella cincta TaxID=48709 RepID=A0A1D2N6I1_ORCCI|nr:hypothetical protein Ocin01_05812 [Orchesella cincta]